MFGKLLMFSKLTGTVKGELNSIDRLEVVEDPLSQTESNLQEIPPAEIDVHHYLQKLIELTLEEDKSWEKIFALLNQKYANNMTMGMYIAKQPNNPDAAIFVNCLSDLFASMRCGYKKLFDVLSAFNEAFETIGTLLIANQNAAIVKSYLLFFKKLCKRVPAEEVNLILTIGGNTNIGNLGIAIATYHPDFITDYFSILLQLRHIPLSNKNYIPMNNIIDLLALTDSNNTLSSLMLRSEKDKEFVLIYIQFLLDALHSGATKEKILSLLYLSDKSFKSFSAKISRYDDREILDLYLQLLDRLSASSDSANHVLDLLLESDLNDNAENFITGLVEKNHKWTIFKLIYLLTEITKRFPILINKIVSVLNCMNSKSINNINIAAYCHLIDVLWHYNATYLGWQMTSLKLEKLSFRFLTIRDFQNFLSDIEYLYNKEIDLKIILDLLKTSDKNNVTFGSLLLHFYIKNPVLSYSFGMAKIIFEEYSELEITEAMQNGIVEDAALKIAERSLAYAGLFLPLLTDVPPRRAVFRYFNFLILLINDNNKLNEIHELMQCKYSSVLNTLLSAEIDVIYYCLSNNLVPSNYLRSFYGKATAIKDHIFSMQNDFERKNALRDALSSSHPLGLFFASAAYRSDLKVMRQTLQVMDELDKKQWLERVKDETKANQEIVFLAKEISHQAKHQEVEKMYNFFNTTFLRVNIPLTREDNIHSSYINYYSYYYRIIPDIKSYLFSIENLDERKKALNNALNKDHPLGRFFDLCGYESDRTDIENELKKMDGSDAKLEEIKPKLENTIKDDSNEICYDFVDPYEQSESSLQLFTFMNQFKQQQPTSYPLFVSDLHDGYLVPVRKS